MVTYDAWSLLVDLLQVRITLVMIFEVEVIPACILQSRRAQFPQLFPVDSLDQVILR